MKSQIRRSVIKHLLEFLCANNRLFKGSNKSSTAVVRFRDLNGGNVATRSESLVFLDVAKSKNDNDRAQTTLDEKSKEDEDDTDDTEIKRTHSYNPLPGALNEVEYVAAAEAMYDVKRAQF